MIPRRSTVCKYATHGSKMREKKLCDLCNRFFIQMFHKFNVACMKNVAFPSITVMWKKPLHHVSMRCRKMRKMEKFILILLKKRSRAVPTPESGQNDRTVQSKHLSRCHGLGCPLCQAHLLTAVS